MLNTFKNLKKKINKQNIKDDVFTKNPQITFFARVTNRINSYCRYTDYSYGIMSLNNDNKINVKNKKNKIIYNLNKSIPDVVKSINIIIKDLNNLNNIKIIIDELEIVLSYDFIQMYNICVEKIIFEHNDGYIIIFPINGSSYISNIIKYRFLITINIKKFLIEINTNETTNDIETFINYFILSEDEKISILSSLDYSNQITLPLNTKTTNENIFSFINEINKKNNEYDDVKYSGYFGIFVIKIDDINLLDSIDIVGNYSYVDFSQARGLPLIKQDFDVCLTKDILRMYNKFNNTIIYKDENNNYFINLILLMNGNENHNINIFKINVNYDNIKDYETDIYLINYYDCNQIDSLSIFENNLLYHNYFEEFNYYITDNFSMTLKQTFTYYLKQIIIYVEDENKKDVNLLNSVELNIDNIIINKYTQKDNMINQYKMNKFYEPNIYNIIFSMDLTSNKPNGNISISKFIKINYELIDNNINFNDYKIKVLVFGYYIK